MATFTSMIRGSAQFYYNLISSHLGPLTSEVVGAPQITLQQYLSTLPCLPLPSGNLQTPVPSIPWCYIPISSSVFLSFFCSFHCPLQNCLRHARRSWDVAIPSEFHFSLPWLGDHHELQLHSGFCCEPPHSSHGLCRKYSEVSCTIGSGKNNQRNDSRIRVIEWLNWLCKWQLA